MRRPLATNAVIDGRAVSVPTGRTVLDACRQHGIRVPTLCHLEGLSAAATCRLCLVEVKGLPRPLPACSTPLWKGMEVATATPALVRHRREVVELLFAGGHHVCAFCPASGRCELQELAREVGLDHVHLGATRTLVPVDASRPRFALDPGRCVLCTRCVRACSELERAHTLGVSGRGWRSRVVADAGRPWGESRTCTDCGKCATACPTGALFEKALAAQGLRERRGRPTAPPPQPEAAPARRARAATVWLGGCSGCHMSLLDLDERLLDLSARMELVYSPLVDAKDYPAGVDLCLVEGAVSTRDHLALVRRVRERTRMLVALGDCAANGNVTAMRDPLGGPGPVLRRAFEEGAGSGPPREPDVPALLDRVLPLSEVVDVDLFLPGCPPPADLIHLALSGLLRGRSPRLEGLLCFG